MASVIHTAVTRIKIFVKNRSAKISEINRKYANPRIHTSGGVKFALLMLRIYLFVLIAILFFKFYTLLHI